MHVLWRQGAIHWGLLCLVQSWMQVKHGLWIRDGNDNNLKQLKTVISPKYLIQYIDFQGYYKRLLNFGTCTDNVYFKGLFKGAFFGNFTIQHMHVGIRIRLKINEGFVQSICRSSIEKIVYSLIPYVLFIDLLINKCVMF